MLSSSDQGENSGVAMLFTYFNNILITSTLHYKSNVVAIRIMKTTTKIITLIAIALLSIESMAQSQEKIYSALILNFARGIQWPISKPTEDFVVGVLGYEPLAEELLGQVDKIKVGNKKIVVREFTSPDEVKDCQILFIPAYKGRLLQPILDKIGAQPILLITNKTDSALKGSGVNLVLVDGKLRYEINCRSIELRGMKISANVKGMGIVVQ